MILADLIQLWNNAWPAGLTMLLLGLLFAVILLIASIRLKVEVEPKIEQIHKALPQIDCGACGYAGCSQYAKAVYNDPKLIGKCAPGGQKTAEAIADILNLQVSGSDVPLRPVVRCRAHTDDKMFHAQYQGIISCTAANALANAQACNFGCLGYGDCVSACKFDALHIVDGLATVDYEKCTGCTACSKACPRNLIEMVPLRHENMMVVACNSKENTKETRAECKVGCIACKLCTKKSELFTVDSNLARLDLEQYEPDEKTETAMDKCPTGVIIKVGKNAPTPRPAGQKPTAAKT